jgi:hypothetical protein
MEGEGFEQELRSAQALGDDTDRHRDCRCHSGRIGTVFAMIEAVSFLQALAILLIGGPLAAFFASWPIALGQGLRALADVAEYVEDQQRSVR